MVLRLLRRTRPVASNCGSRMEEGRLAPASGGPEDLQRNSRGVFRALTECSWGSLPHTGQRRGPCG